LPGILSAEFSTFFVRSRRGGSLNDAGGGVSHGVRARSVATRGRTRSGLLRFQHCLPNIVNLHLNSNQDYVRFIVSRFFCFTRFSLLDFSVHLFSSRPFFARFLLTTQVETRFEFWKEIGRAYRERWAKVFPPHWNALGQVCACARNSALLPKQIICKQMSVRLCCPATIDCQFSEFP
jgi:hypothetical protein